MVAVVEEAPIHRLVFNVLHHFPSFLVRDEIMINELHMFSTPDISRDSRLLVTFLCHVSCPLLWNAMRKKLSD